jgi:hypothetical protein
MPRVGETPAASAVKAAFNTSLRSNMRDRNPRTDEEGEGEEASELHIRYT